MRATDVMLVFLMLTVWGQNYQVVKEIDYVKTRLARAVVCRTSLPTKQK